MSALEQFNRMDLLQAADLLSKSNLVPKSYRGKPADIVVARLWGEEAGIGMFAALQYLDVIDGNPTVNADGCNALIRRAGHSLWFEMSPDKCVAHGKRADTGDGMTVTWTMQMAKDAGLANKQVWKSYAADMLKARATTQIARALFADVLMGVKYAPEEAASFAAPELLDSDADALASATMGRGTDGPAALPAGGDTQHVSSEQPRAAGAGSTRGAQPPLPVADPQTGEIIDTSSSDKGDGVLAAGLRATESRNRTFPPPTQREAKPTSADNTHRIMAEFAAADAVTALRERVNNIDPFQKDSLRDEWKAAGLPSITRAAAKLTPDELKLAVSLVDKAERAAEVA